MSVLLPGSYHVVLVDLHWRGARYALVAVGFGPVASQPRLARTLVPSRLSRSERIASSGPSQLLIAA
jgi:hypothetical protein